MFVVFFFFQAEDGIRDVAVTGVQTCALPISTCQLNCFAVTLTSKSLAGTCILILDHAGTLRAVRITRISAGTMVHAISSGVLPCVYRAVRPGRSRYITMNTSIVTKTRTNVAPVM